MTQVRWGWKQEWPMFVRAVLVVLLIGGFFGGLGYVNWLMKKPPDGAHGEVVVEFYTDGSPLCQLQAQTIAELQSQYEGPITFKTIDVREHPEVTKEYEGREFGAVKYLPTVRVVSRWLDKDGKQISGGWNSGGQTTKRNLVWLIEGAAGSHQQFWPAMPIKRNRPAVP
jgi:thiol-disulfide isomerase/thioredoxin